MCGVSVNISQPKESSSEAHSPSSVIKSKPQSHLILTSPGHAVCAVTETVLSLFYMLMAGEGCPL